MKFEEDYLLTFVWVSFYPGSFGKKILVYYRLAA